MVDYSFMCSDDDDGEVFIKEFSKTSSPIKK